MPLWMRFWQEKAIRASVDLKATLLQRFPVGAVLVGENGSILGDGVNSVNKTAITAALTQVTTCYKQYAFLLFTTDKEQSYMESIVGAIRWR